jgi:hypothetical protein
MADETKPSGEPLAEKPKYNQEFFLALTLKGKDAWNNWRRDPANKDVAVTFADVNFREEPWDRINFSGFEFGDYTDFSRCEWRGVEYEQIEQDPKAFTLGRACFIGAVFGKVARFDDAIFGDCANFDRATFNDEASFEGAAFGWWASFSRSIFKGDAEFTGKLKQQLFGQQQREDLWREDHGRPDHFLTISFAHTLFYGEAVFFRRSFEVDADFTNTRFYYPPDFDAAINATRVDFSGAHIDFLPPGKLFHWTTSTQIPVRLRALRKIAEETKNHDLERDLYIEERKGERGVYLLQRWEDLKKEGWKNWPRNAVRLCSHILWIGIMALYWALADYGRSFARPIVWWLVLSLIIFPWWYGEILAPLKEHAGRNNASNYEEAIQLVARGNAVPFVGPLTIDPEIKKFLFCPGFGNCLPIPPKSYQWLVVFQNVVSIILVFFIGLALRNYFKIK